MDDEIDEDIKNVEDMVSFEAMKAAFCIREDDVIDEAVQNKWNAIQKIFRDRSLQIMPRNLKMVKNYCAVGCRCMERDTPATKFAPLDYALSQKILPTINGNGENYRMLIEDLLKECTAQNMPISAKHLERMKRIAENNMGFYQSSLDKRLIQKEDISMMVKCTLSCQNPSQRAEFNLSDCLMDMSSVDFSKCAAVFEDGSYEIYFVCEQYNRTEVKSVAVCVNGEQVGDII